MRSLVLSALILASAFQIAMGQTDGAWTYTLANNQATIKGYTGLGGAVSIPSTVNGISVVQLSSNNNPIFGWYNTSVTSVIIPNSVTSIGEAAFESCHGLTSVIIPNSVTSIGSYAFHYCISLTSVTIPNSVTSIGNSAFLGCGSLTSVTIPNSVTSIGGGAFRYCAARTSVVIPSSVTSIGSYAFQRCSSLTSVTIPNSVTSIGNSAFAICTNLTSVTIPNSVTSIEDYAFLGCTILLSVSIPNSVTSIGESAFQSCTSLTSVTIPNSVTSIGSYAFYGCFGLASIVLPSPNTLVGINAIPASTAILYTNQLISLAMDSDFGTALASNSAFVTALANNPAFVFALVNSINATSDNYGFATQSGVSSAISTAVQPLATKTELTSALTESRTAGVNSVLSNPNLWTLYTTSQIQNMAVGDLVLTRQVSGGFVLNYDIEQSTDLQTWTTYQALSLPLTGLPTDKAFVRIKPKQ